ncbi:hypothetical protein C8Q79DRAFT_287262 [Trametes meyenii]|nr:hypothetical protein C8Q79DRAFT_287262 [Trametes meyenii]
MFFNLLDASFSASTLAAMSVTLATQYSERPTVLVLHFLREELEDAEPQLYAELRKATSLMQARTTQAALEVLSHPARPQAVLVADASVTSPSQVALLDALVEYARDGGRVIFGVRFSSHFLYFPVSPFFRRFGMNWDRGRFCESTSSLNPDGLPRLLLQSTLPPKLSLRAQLLKDVHPEDAVYLSPTTPEADPLSLSAGHVADCFAAFAPLARGYVGYVGNVDGEPEVTPLLLEMLGAQNKEPVSGKKHVLVSNGAYLASESVDGCRAKGVNENPPTRPIVLVLRLTEDIPLSVTHNQLLNGLEKNARVYHVNDNATAMARLVVFPPPQAVIVSDATLTQSQNSVLVEELQGYARLGGRVLLGPYFGARLDRSRAASFFSKWSVPWTMGSNRYSTFALNPSGVPTPLSSEALFPTFNASAQCIKTSSPGEIIYGNVRTKPRNYNSQQHFEIARDEGAALWAPAKDF